MKIKSLIQRVRSLRHDRRGGVAITFAITALPMMAMVGAGIDYGKLTNARTDLKIATDAAALALTHVATTDSASALQAAAVNMVTASVPSNITGLTVTGTYSTATSKVTVTASASVKTAVMNAFGISTMPTSATSVASFGGGRLRVALVLDNTGSMADNGKMPALITATNNLLDILKTAGASSNDVYVSVVPFDVDVNIGSSNSAASYIDWTTWDANNGSCKNSTGKSKSYYTQTSCKNANSSYVWTHDAHTTWNGCVMDRSQNYDTVATAPVIGTTATYYPADQYSSCPPAIMGLNRDFTAMKAAVSAMTPLGSTNQAIGLAWGWQTLVGGGPLTVPAEDPNYVYEHVINLLTDGLNTVDRWYSKASSIDARQAITCTGIKASGVKVYTIQVNTGGDATSTVLKDCATTGEYFTVLTSADQILGTLTNIGNGLGKVSLSE